MKNPTPLQTKPVSQQGQRYRFDVLVIGSGIAGLTYILELLQLNPMCNIALITKQSLDDSNSQYAQGGIAAVSLTEDSVEQHIADTIKASDNLAHRKSVQAILSEGPRAIKKLMQYGVQFDRDNKHFELAQEGAHSYRRIYHVGDYTGQAIMLALKQAVLALPQVKIFEYHTAINLITQNKIHAPTNNTEVLGAYILDEKNLRIHTFLSNLTVLATGGAGKVYRYTSNREFATGDGIAMAFRAGAHVGNLEFYQFHPTLLYHTELNNFLISEALRGEGGILTNPITNNRFMKDYAPKEMELATRDVVARAIFNEIENTGSKFVYLDMRHKNKKYLKNRFPTIFDTLFNIGIDISKDPIPVVPGAHYLCGGILTNVDGQTDLKRLYAIGETAFTGLHGANRLASNSLLEGAVMARFAAKHCLKYLAQPITQHQHINDWDSKGVIDIRRATQINAHWHSLRGEMTSYAGIIRTEEGLKDLLKLITTRRQMIEDYYWKYVITRDLIELRNIILTAELIVRSALLRKESRGGHYREDHPEKNALTKDTILQMNEIRNILITNEY